MVPPFLFLKNPFLLIFTEDLQSLVSFRIQLP